MVKGNSVDVAVVEVGVVQFCWQLAVGQTRLACFRVSRGRIRTTKLCTKKAVYQLSCETVRR
jgi:hypothetical protein